MLFGGYHMDPTCGLIVVIVVVSLRLRDITPVKSDI